MLLFKFALITLCSTYILSVCSQITQESNYLDIGLGLLCIASGVIAGKIIYDRYQQIHILGSLTLNPNVTSFANKIASISVCLLSMGFLGHVCLLQLKVDSYTLMAISIFSCGFGTLYIWMQCMITTYLSTLYYDRHLSVLRQCLANLSFLVLVVMTVFGTASTIMPRGSSKGIFICLLATSICSYVLSAIFCIFILTFQKEYVYFAQGLRTDCLLDDTCSLNNESLSDMEELFQSQNLSKPTNKTIILKGSITCAKIS